MTLADTADQYFTYESRLTSFQTAQQLSKRRTSNANSNTPKTLKWPHQSPSAEELAKAGFFYNPTHANPDNVVCFLCHKSLDGWEEDDDPVAEHLKHSADCGWAIVAAVESQDGNFSGECPTSTRMIDARRATFADKWPHENKKGWKCKIKQMVDAGWKYTPTPEYDDTATCTYCSLALDGWEQADKPLDEHYKRSPDCPFFALSNEYNKQGSARKSRAKKDRSSKASRLSTQSTFTTASDVASLADLPADDDDSILTTATNATATPAAKKMDKRKRTTTGRSRKTKAKKSEAVEVHPPAEFKDNDLEVLEVPAAKSTRGRKRKSDQIQDSGRDDVEAEAPAAKRRTTQTRQSSAIEDVALIIEPSADQAFTDEPPTSTEPSRAKRGGRPSRKPSARKPSARKPSARVASRKVPAPRVLSDEEIDAALQADLDKHVSEDEETSIVKKATKSGKIVNAEYAMFNPEPMDIDEDVIDAELEAMEAEAKPPVKPKAPRGRPRKASAKQTAAAKKAAEAEAEAREAADELAVDQITSELELSISMQHSPPALKPKKQRAASRKVSEQAPAQNSNSSLLSSHDSSIIQPDDLQTSVIHQNIQHEPTEDFGNDTNLSMASQSTVIRSSTSTLRGSTIKKRGRPSKHRIASRNIEAIIRPSQNSPSNEDKIDELQATAKEESLDETSMAEERFYTPAPEFRPEEEKRVSDVSKAQPPKPRGRPPKIPREPVTIVSATPPQKQGKRSQSPQSSDIENQPPSSKPSTVKKSATPKATSTRVPLSATTPALSPSKLNVISSLKSSNPWTVVDLDAIFLKTPGDENAIEKGLLDDAISKVKNSELTSPEKKMTVEEWIVYNGRVAEENLRNECERMVGTFEREGTRAMAALEGVECTE